MQNLFSPLFGRFGSAGLSAPQANSTGSAMTTPSWQKGTNFWTSRLPSGQPNASSYSIPNNFDASAPGGSPAVGLPVAQGVTSTAPAPITSMSQLPSTAALMNQSMPGSIPVEEPEPMPMIPPDPNATSLPPAMPSILDPMGTGGAGLAFGTGMGGEPIDQHAMANAMAQQQYMTSPNAGDGVFANPNAQPPWANAGGQSYANDVGFDLTTGLWDPSDDVAPPPVSKPAPPTSGPGTPNAFNYKTGNYSNWKDMPISKRAKKFGDWRPLTPKELTKVNTSGQMPSGYAFRKGELGISNSKYMAQNNLMGGPGRIGTMYSGMYGNTGPAHVPSAGWQYMNR